MDCSSIEQRLSDYLESALPVDERNEIRVHLDSCESCAALFREMRSLISTCRQQPTLEMDVDLLEKILLRTSGRPRTLTLREQLHLLFQSLLTPKFATGAGLAILFLALSLNLMLPRVSTAFSSMSALQLLSWMDRGAQFAYGEGLKAFDKKDEWMADFRYLKTTAAQKMRFMMEQFNIPMEEGWKKPAEPIREIKHFQNEKNSSIFSWQASLTRRLSTGEAQL
jgi:hypothetical protein